MAEDSRSQTANASFGAVVGVAVVLFFIGNNKVKDLEREIRSVRGEVSSLQLAIRQQTEEQKRLQPPVKP